MRRLATIFATTITTLALAAPAAMAANSGEGLYGETDDKVVTYAGFILIVAFPVTVLLLSLLQGKLEKRKKDRMKAAKAAGGDDRWKQGW
jgi:preprotein translocase subunit SecG